MKYFNGAPHWKLQNTITQNNLLNHFWNCEGDTAAEVEDICIFETNDKYANRYCNDCYNCAIQKQELDK